MSPREKKLILFFAIAGFVILNFFGFNYYTTKKTAVHTAQVEADTKLIAAENFSKSREQVLDQMEWLAEHEPQPAAFQDVQSALQQLVEREAQANGLTIRPNSQKLLPVDQTDNRIYHRAKIKITVTGTEKALYAWFDKLNIPEQFRAATNINLTPDREDDTKIDCTTTIEQWFVPTPST